MKILHLNLKKKYFEQILSGEKKFEYREIKKYWIKRLQKKKYDLIEFKNGYSKDARKFYVEYLGYEIQTRKFEITGQNINVYAIKLGNIVNINSTDEKR